MKPYLILVALMLAASSAVAQSEEVAVRAVIDQLFDGMRLADTTMVGQAFAPDAILATIGRPDNPNIVTNSPASLFARNVGRPRTDVWDERIDYVEIKVDGNMASAWVPYAFYLGDTFSHCGVNSMQFAKIGGRWQITYLIDTRRKDSCIVQ